MKNIFRLIIVSLLMIMSSCRSQDIHYVAVQDTALYHHTIIDTIKYVDSTYIQVRSYGDTLLHVYEYHHLTDLRRSEKNDSAFSNRSEKHDDISTNVSYSNENNDYVLYLLISVLIILIFVIWKIFS